VDETCARLLTEIDSTPTELDAIARRVKRLEIGPGLAMQTLQNLLIRAYC